PVLPRLARGEGLAESLAATGAFPADVIAMARTGEASGKLDALLDCVAEFYELEAALRLHRLSVSLGVAALLAVGALVGAAGLL
ncbi:MAG: type II secretion system F family protein, partial [Acetobacteraceae bacterium]|nr:type II secretion system F family protein [Acetobacteraceae bacterium]